jgi:hypothetical protein
VVERILELRKNVTERGLDAGSQTIAWHLEREQISVSSTTISRILTRHGAVVPDPSERPKSSYRRFQAELPNHCGRPPIVGSGQAAAGRSGGKAFTSL